MDNKLINYPITTFIAPHPPTSRIVVFSAGTTRLQLKHEKRDAMSYCSIYSEISVIQHSMGPENNVGLGGCRINECLLSYLCMVTVPHISGYRGSTVLGNFLC